MTVVAYCLAAAVLRGQSMTGEVRLHVEDPESLGVKAKVELRSDANQYFNAQTSDEAGILVAKRLLLGTETIEQRAESLPGRSLQELVNSQPGRLYEGNAVLHPRGSEYQTQFVVDGMP